MVGKRFGTAAMVAAFAMLLTQTANADDWKAQLKGLDGVVLWCTDASKQKLGVRVCEKFLNQAQDKFGAKDVPVKRKGYLSDKDEQPDHAFLKGKLAYRLFIRGVKDRDMSLQLRVRASVAYAAAVERDDASNPRKGDLVLWERSTVGAGPANELEKQISDFVLGYSAENLDEIVSGWPSKI